MAKWQNVKWQMARMMATHIDKFVLACRHHAPGNHQKVPNVSQEVCFWEHASDGGDTRLFLMWKLYERLNLGSWESYTDYMVFYFTRGGCHVESIVIGTITKKKMHTPTPDMENARWGD